MVNLIIRPLQDEELEGYFKLRYESALKNNTALLNEAVSALGMEIDSFDFSAIHIGCFDSKELIACVRIAFPPAMDNLDIGKRESQNLMTLLSSLKEKFPPSPICLPSSAFLAEKERKILEAYFQQFLDKGKKIAEVGRLISFSDKFSLKSIISCLSYIYALCILQGIDYCFFNAPVLHTKFYSKYFPCERIFPEIKFDTGAKSKKELILTDVKISSFPQREYIQKILIELQNQSYLIHFNQYNLLI